MGKKKTRASTDPTLLFEDRKKTIPGPTRCWRQEGGGVNGRGWTVAVPRRRGKARKKREIVTGKHEQKRSLPEGV